jgi:predicted chitinase
MKPLITIDELRQLMPHLGLHDAGLFLPHLAAALKEQAITSKKRRCAFLSQLAHESLDLTHWHELGDGRRYEHRLDLGNTMEGDGPRYKGRGPIQLTGRKNYRRVGKLLGVDLEGTPELAAVPEYGFRIAAVFWKVGGLNELADKLTLNARAYDHGVIQAITKRINGGLNGLDARWIYYSRAVKVLHDDEELGPEQPSPAPLAPAAARQVESPDADESDVDLLDAAVSSKRAQTVGIKLWPRIVKHGGAGVTFVWAIIEAHKVAGVLVLVVLFAGVAWLTYHNSSTLKRRALKLLK